MQAIPNPGMHKPARLIVPMTPESDPGSAWPMKLILEATDQGIYVLDGDGRCTLFNRAASVMTGWSARESLGRSIHDLIHHTRPGGSPHPIEQCPALSVLCTGLNVHRYSETYWRKDGTSFPVEYSSSPIIKSGHTVGAVVVFSDITERRQVEKSLRDRDAAESTYRATLNILEDFDEEKAKLRDLHLATMNLLEDMYVEREKSVQTQRALINILDDVEIERVKVEQAKAMLESANKELEAFSYSVSHDLRAPLRAISGFTDALMEDWRTQIDKEGLRYLGLVQENAHKMGQLIDDLLAFSRLGRQPMNLTEFDMAELAQSVFDELRAHVPERSIGFTMGRIPKGYGDRALIRQVLVNLLSNAIKFTRQQQAASITFGCRTKGNQDQFEISDNGVGFEMQYVGKLFGVFQRLHSVTEFEGTGVGLALVSRIITRHGGTARAEGRVNQGATFSFSLPKRGIK